MNATRRQATHLVVRYGMFALSLSWIGFALPQFVMRLRQSDWIALAVMLALEIVMLRISVPLISVASQRRRNAEAGRLTLEMPIAVTVFTIYGGVATAAFVLVAYLFAIPSDGRSRLMRRILDGSAETIFWLVLGLARPFVLPTIRELSPAGFAAYVALFVGGLFVFVLLVWDPLKWLRGNVLLIRLWRRSISDTRLWCFEGLLAAWGYLCTQVLLHDGNVLGLASFAPLPFLAFALRSLHEHRLELHRLRLARDAVQAMLGARDPLPQMNSLLSSIHTPNSRETLQIYASISPGDERLAPLASIGPAPTADEFELCRRAMLELQRGDLPSVTHHSDDHTVTAYAVRTVHDELLGTLIVHQPLRAAALLPTRRFENAAAGLAPLLRDFRSIAATQSAASIDALTGLANRRTIMEMLRERIEHVTIGNPCAILLIDIDHFKSVNDELGHLTGDQCLRMVGVVIARNIRGGDRAGRIGGEEFVILMPDTTRELAMAVGERLRMAIEGAEMRHANGGPVTASIGVAVASLSDTVDSLLARADRALYEAKRQGRNRVVEISA